MKICAVRSAIETQTQVDIPEKIHQQKAVKDSIRVVRHEVDCLPSGRGLLVGRPQTQRFLIDCIQQCCARLKAGAGDLQRRIT